MKEFFEYLFSNFSKVFRKIFNLLNIFFWKKYTLNWIISLNLSTMIESPKSIQKLSNPIKIRNFLDTFYFINQ
jgi:hypothetical protein